MKKILTLLLVAALSASALTACGNTNNTPTNDNPSIEEAQNNKAVQETTDEATNVKLVYGTATLTYAEFYEGDVSSTDSYDAVTSATTSKYQIMGNMATDFVDEETNAEGYHITGVQNVNLSIAESDVEAYQAINPTFTLIDYEPAQYKPVAVENGKAVYSATVFYVADEVSDATAELITGSNWGDYQINVTDGATTHLRNTREDEFDINSQIQGIILETESGIKVGMEYLQSIWVQPYEVSWNVPEDNTHNTHISAFDNLPELQKLTGERVTKITYIMPDSTYVYEFDGIYIKPIYSGNITAAASENYDKIILSTAEFNTFENGTLSVYYTLGSGREREIVTLLETDLETGTDTYVLDISAIAEMDKGGVYSAVITSDTYADVTVSMPATGDQRTALEHIVETAKEKLAENTENKTLAEHIAEGEELLGNKNASSAEVGSLINELKQLTSDEQHAPGNQGGHGGN